MAWNFLNCKTGLESKARSVRERGLKRRRIEITAFRRVTTAVSGVRIEDSVDSTAHSANQLTMAANLAEVEEDDNQDSSIPAEVDEGTVSSTPG